MGCDLTAVAISQPDRESIIKRDRQHLVTRSISGHATETMQHHYSSVRSEEKREGVAKVTDLMAVRLERAKQAQSTAEGEHHSGARKTTDPSTIPAPGGAQAKGGGAHHEKAS